MHNALARQLNLNFSKPKLGTGKTNHSYHVSIYEHFSSLNLLIEFKNISKTNTQFGSVDAACKT